MLESPAPVNKSDICTGLRFRWVLARASLADAQSPEDRPRRTDRFGLERHHYGSEQPQKHVWRAQIVL
jgi:hypothetical protein